MGSNSIPFCEYFVKKVRDAGYVGLVRGVYAQKENPVLRDMRRVAICCGCTLVSLNTRFRFSSCLLFIVYIYGDVKK